MVRNPLSVLQVLRDGSLETGVKVTAGPEAPLSFTDVLHTYFNYRGEPLVGFEGESAAPR